VKRRPRGLGVVLGLGNLAAIRAVWTAEFIRVADRVSAGANESMRVPPARRRSRAFISGDPSNKLSIHSPPRFQKSLMRFDFDKL
jgi:hypothetical protein